MSESKLPNADGDFARRENALVGYQMAISLWTYQEEQGWARFNFMLVANSLVIAVIGLALTSQRPLIIFTGLLPVAGLLLCGIWFAVIKRESAYSDYYVLSARELEEKYLFDPVKTVSRGGLFAEGSTVTFEINGKPTNLRMVDWHEFSAPSLLLAGSSSS